MLLADILKELDSRVIAGDPDCEVSSVEFDSRRAKEGSVFVCIKGFTVDGHSFAGQATSPPLIGMSATISKRRFS